MECNTEFYIRRSYTVRVPVKDEAAMAATVAAFAEKIVKHGLLNPVEIKGVHLSVTLVLKTEPTDNPVDYGTSTQLVELCRYDNDDGIIATTTKSLDMPKAS